jgi:hypothetical protein
MIALAPTATPLITQLGPLPAVQALTLQPTLNPLTATGFSANIIILPQAVSIIHRTAPARITVGGPFAPSGRRILGLFRDNRLASAQAE